MFSETSSTLSTASDSSSRDTSSLRSSSSFRSHSSFVSSLEYRKPSSDSLIHTTLLLRHLNKRSHHDFADRCIRSLLEYRHLLQSAIPADPSHRFQCKDLVNLRFKVAAAEYSKFDGRRRKFRLEIFTTWVHALEHRDTYPAPPPGPRVFQAARRSDDPRETPRLVLNTRSPLFLPSRRKVRCHFTSVSQDSL